MPVYTYKARTSEGELVKGKAESSGEAGILKSLEKKGVYPFEVKETKGSGRSLSFLNKKKKIKNDEKILFTRQLESMLKSGVSLTGSIHALSEQTESELFHDILVTIRKDIEGGMTFTQALRKHPNLYGELYVNLIHAGEQAGLMDEMLERIGDLLEYDTETKERIKQATFYPGLVIGELALAFAVIIKFVFPRFKALFSARGADLPLPTKIMILVSDFSEQYWLHFLIGVGLLVMFVRWYRKTPRGKLLQDGLLLKVPIFGTLILKILMSRFARILSALLDSALPILRALEIVERTIDNIVVKREIEEMRAGIQKGKGIVEAIPKDGVFPPPVVKMLEVGEMSGNLDHMLRKVSEFYDRQVDYMIKNLTTVIEPILLAVLGVSVLFIALAVFLPMWNLMNVVTGQ